MCSGMRDFVSGDNEKDANELLRKLATMAYDELQLLLMRNVSNSVRTLLNKFQDICNSVLNSAVHDIET